MFTQCPECLTIYALDTATVAQAEGRVGCGQCGATFNALATLTQTLPDDLFDILPVHPASPAPPILMMAVVHDAPPQQALFEAATAVAPADPALDADAGGTFEQLDSLTEPAPDDTDADAVDAPAIPSFARDHRAPVTARHRRYWAAGCAVLTLALAIQLIYAERVPLTANATTRSWLAAACTWLDCTLPPVSDTAALQLLSRDVRPHPSVAGALLISATVRNNAPFTQPYPIVSITLSDLDSNRIAMRRFRPAEYIADPKVRTAGLAPGQTAALMFEVKDPGRNAVAFQFGFE